jgi:hypothetical protein
MLLARRAGELLLGAAVAMLPLASHGAPTGVRFSAPAAGATISGSFSDSSGCQVTGTRIARVVFFMDNTQLNTENSAPWQCRLDTRNLANGTHTLRAVAYDSAGASTTVTRSVNVQNGSVSGPTAILAWDAVTHPNLRGYRVYFGTAPRTYFQAAGNGVDVGNAITATVAGFSSGTRYYFSVTAYDTSNKESAFSNEVFKDIPY